MKTNIRVHVVFRHQHDPLTNMFKETFTSVKEAKAAIKCDAEYFLKHHNIIPNLMKKGVRQSAKWINPESEDYYQVTAKDGTTCIWQYFAFPAHS